MMRFSHFIIYILVGLFLEYLLRLIFPGHPIIIVPELIIFLTIVDMGSKDVLPKFIVSAVLYDFWMSPQVGVLTIALMIMLFVLYFLWRISYLDSKSIRGRLPWPHILALTLSSEFLFLIYYFSSYILDKIVLVRPISWSWRLSLWSEILPVGILTTTIFLVLYSSYSFAKRPKAFKS